MSTEGKEKGISVPNYKWWLKELKLPASEWGPTTRQGTTALFPRLKAHVDALKVSCRDSHDPHIAACCLFRLARVGRHAFASVFLMQCMYQGPSRRSWSPC